LERLLCGTSDWPPPKLIDNNQEASDDDNKGKFPQGCATPTVTDVHPSWMLVGVYRPPKRGKDSSLAMFIAGILELVLLSPPQGRNRDTTFPDMTRAQVDTYPHQHLIDVL
jgi:hypothetical protein